MDHIMLKAHINTSDRDIVTSLDHILTHFINYCSKANWSTYIIHVVIYEEKLSTK